MKSVKTCVCCNRRKMAIIKVDSNEYRTKFVYDCLKCDSRMVITKFIKGGYSISVYPKGDVE